MKAIVFDKYGDSDVLVMRDVPIPQPQGTEMLVRVYAASLNAYDWHLMMAKPIIARTFSGLLKPRDGKLGADFAGVVEAIGSEVTRFKVGDAVYGDNSSSGGGTAAEYCLTQENRAALMPKNMSYEEAAGVPMAALTALQGLRDITPVVPGDKVLIHGASGGVGSFAVQIAKSMGAEVTAVCSTAKVAQTRSLGADHVIDYTQEDFTQNGVLYDFILGVGGGRSLKEYTGSLKPTGTYVMAGGNNKQIFQTVLLSGLYTRKGGKTAAGVSCVPCREDLEKLTAMIEAGQLRTLVDRVFPLEQYRAAMDYLYSGHPAGKIIITMAAN